MSIADIRKSRGVPAKRGMRVVVDGHPGVITGAGGGNLNVRFDGRKHTARCHPTWRVDYLDATGKSLMPSCPRGEHGATCCACLPVGKSCGDCAHIKRCEAFGFTDSRERVECDFGPSRFREKAAPETVAP